MIAGAGLASSIRANGWQAARAEQSICTHSAVFTKSTTASVTFRLDNKGRFRKNNTVF